MYYLTGILGVAAMVAPYLFGFSSNPPALWTSLIVGAVLIVASVLEGLAGDKDDVEYWVAGLTGLVAIIAPFVLGFSGMTLAYGAVAAVGVVTVLVAGARLFLRLGTHTRYGF